MAEKKKEKQQTQPQNEMRNLPTNWNHDLIQQALGFGNSAIAQQRQATGQAVDRLEGSMYEQVGQQMLQTERDISKRRMQAVRSGMPSSAVAAMELQNLQTAQMGAQQTSREYDQMRTELMREYAGAEDMQAQGMLDLINQNIATAEQIDAQRLPSDWAMQFEELGINTEDLSSDELLKAVIAISTGDDDIIDDIGGSLRSSDRTAKGETLNFKTDGVTPEVKSSIASKYNIPEDKIEGNQVFGKGATSEDIGVGFQRFSFGRKTVQDNWG